MINLFSFFIKKKESTLPSIFEKTFEIEEYLKLQDTLLVFFEKRQHLKVEKIRNGIIHLSKATIETHEDKFNIQAFLEMLPAGDESYEDSWTYFLNGFDYIKLLKWQNAEKHLNTAVFAVEMLQKKAITSRWISEKEREVFVLKLPNRIIQIPNDWLKAWEKTTEDLINSITKKRESFLNLNLKNPERTETHTKRPVRKKLGESVIDFSFNLNVNTAMKDRKSGMINDQVTPLGKEETLSENIRFTGGETNR